MKITVKHHALDQCEVLVAGRRVAYICYGEDAKLNWLSTKYLKQSGDQLTVEEKVAIAKHVRSVMKKLTAEREAYRDEVAAVLEGEKLPADFFKHEPVEGTIGSAKTPSADKKDK